MTTPEEYGLNAFSPLRDSPEGTLPGSFVRTSDIDTITITERSPGFVHVFITTRYGNTVHGWADELMIVD